MCLVSIDGFGAIDGRGASAFRHAEVLKERRVTLKATLKLHWRHVDDCRGMVMVLDKSGAFFLRRELLGFGLTNHRKALATSITSHQQSSLRGMLHG